MSKIYDALIQAGRKSDSRTTVFRGTADEAAPLRWARGIRLEWEIMGAVAAAMVVFGFLLIILASQRMSSVLQSEMDQRALAITTNLSDAATRHVIGRNILELYVLLMKYARLDGVAYAFIEDSNGQIVAHSRKPFPPELKGNATSDERKQVKTKLVTLEGKTVHETSVPILEGQLGAAHMGMWADSVKTKIENARRPFVGLTTLILFVAIAIVALVVHLIIRSIRAISDIATQNDSP